MTVRSEDVFQHPCLSEQGDFRSEMGLRRVVEASISSAIKSSIWRFDLGKCVDAEGKITFVGGMNDLERTCKSGRLPPLLPERVSEMLRNGTVKFTNGSDIARVESIYRKFFEAATSFTKDLS